MSRTNSPVVPATTKNFKQEIIAIKNKSENKYCADCLATETAWASTNLGVFVCINCSGVHRSLGTHVSKVKSVELDEWNDEEQYEIMSQVGNVEANAYWECNLFPFEKPSAHDKYSFRKKFITDKYIKKAYIPSMENSDFKLEREFDISLTSKKGHITKQGAKRKNWKKRWFVLHDDTLSYYKSQTDSYPAGSVKIEIDSLVMFVDEFQIGKKNCFAVVTKNRNYYMFCDLEEEVNEWVYALRASVYYANLKKVYNDPRNFLRGDQAKRVEKKGILKKQGGSFKSIKTRFFVLKDSTLSYYKSEKEMEPIDSIDLKGTRVEQTKNTKCGITLHTVGRQYFFLAETEKDREEWIEAINNVTKVLNEGELIQKKSIAIHQLIINKIKEAKKERANEILGEQVSPHSPMMWKSLSFHRCRNQFLDRLEEGPVSDGNINPVERLKSLFQEGKITNTRGSSLGEHEDLNNTRVSLMYPEGMKILGIMNDEKKISLLTPSSPSSSSSNGAVGIPGKASLLSNVDSSGSSPSASSPPANSNEQPYKIDDIKLDKQKNQKKAKKDQLVIEHDVVDGDHAMEIMIKDSFSVKRNNATVRESDDLDDLDDLINHTESVKLKYDSTSEEDEVSSGDEVSSRVNSNTQKKSSASNLSHSSSKASLQSSASSRRILDSDSDGSDQEISLSNVKPQTKNSSTKTTSKIVLKQVIVSSDDDEDETATVEATFTLTPVETPTSPVVSKIKTRNVTQRSDKDKPKRKKKHQTTFRRMHTLVEDQLQSIGIDVE
ncbi:hypothetical protein FDP41_008943 [Naegleria fowleri]|uniref:Uncharacterized protein n=1 Tax=Naegleria fowleri TaxID=5763 RepID=A0A6A5BF85_NAEFO|nr:uncharacterized protein FDP41_008943 [Naegleria fowleri]KAF0972694.1 hypothetical protein FDP41_008943 [Naegleria fowleri]CAG4715586.1 unnamed protein product [Naegleria fowleri]